MPSGPPYDTLSAYQLFKGPLAAQTPADGVMPYDVVSTLYADGAGKFRFLSIPKGTKIHFDPSARWDFPDGTMAIKTFFYELDPANPGTKRQLLETRILRKSGGLWSANTYLWNDAQTEANRFVAGQLLHIQFVDGTGVDYQVPSTSVCRTCHGQDSTIVPLGPRTRQLNRLHDYGNGPENQLTHLATLGWLDAALPSLDTVEQMSDPHGMDSVDARARSYLEANCSHCHNPQGFAASTNLRLDILSPQPINYGVCKTPVAAGPAAGTDKYDIVPGHPELSIVVRRLSSNDPMVKMPPLPLTTVDSFGVDLISQWVTGMTFAACP